MKFLEDISNFISPNEPINLDYRYINLNGKYLYLEGIKGVLTLTDKEIEFSLSKKKINIKGEDLFLKYFDNSTALISGRIIQIIVL